MMYPLNDTLSAIHRMSYKRMANGKTVDEVTANLCNKMSTVWKYNEPVKEFICNLTVELQFFVTPYNNEEIENFAMQYVIKYLAENQHKPTSEWNISDEYFDELFKNCALPLNPRFYPLLRLEIFKMAKEGK